MLDRGVPQTLEYRSPDPRRPWHRRASIWVAAIAALATLGAIGIALQPSTVRCGCARCKCTSNEHQIGLGILLYQQDHAGHYPPALADLLADEQIGPEVFVCPESNDAPAVLASTQPTTRQVAAALAVPGHVSYVYCGHADWTDPIVPADAVVLYEPVADHGGDGSNILYGDGHADWVPMPRAARLIAAAAATTRPVSAASVP